LGESIILPQLPGAEQEALDIADQLGATPLIGAEATKTTILERISDAGLIHFATHGLLETGLLTDIPGAIAVAQTDGGFTTQFP
jgi:CHAT domain-containing protein